MANKMKKKSDSRFSGYRCTVPSCKNNKRSHGILRWFKFPIHDKQLLQKWQEQCDCIIDIKENHTICEIHFEKKYLKTKYLPRNAYPTLNLAPIPTSSRKRKERDELEELTTNENTTTTTLSDENDDGEEEEEQEVAQNNAEEEEEAENSDSNHKNKNLGPPPGHDEEEISIINETTFESEDIANNNPLELDESSNKVPDIPTTVNLETVILIDDNSDEENAPIPKKKQNKGTVMTNKVDADVSASTQENIAKLGEINNKRKLEVEEAPTKSKKKKQKQTDNLAPLKVNQQQTPTAPTPIPKTNTIDGIRTKLIESKTPVTVTVAPSSSYDIKIMPGERILNAKERLAVVELAKISRHTAEFPAIFNCSNLQINKILLDYKYVPSVFTTNTPIVRNRTSREMVAINMIANHWIQRAQAYNLRFSDKCVREYANDVAKLISYNKFSATSRWLERLAKKYKIGKIMRNINISSADELELNKINNIELLMQDLRYQIPKDLYDTILQNNARKIRDIKNGVQPSKNKIVKQYGRKNPMFIKHSTIQNIVNISPGPFTASMPSTSVVTSTITNPKMSSSDALSLLAASPSITLLPIPSTTTCSPMGGDSSVNKTLLTMPTVNPIPGTIAPPISMQKSTNALTKRSITKDSSAKSTISNNNVTAIQNDKIDIEYNNLKIETFAENKSDVGDDDDNNEDPSQFENDITDDLEVQNAINNNNNCNEKNPIQTYEDALKYLAPLEEFALLKSQFRALNFISCLETIFEEEMSK